MARYEPGPTGTRLSIQDALRKKRIGLPVDDTEALMAGYAAKGIGPQTAKPGAISLPKATYGQPTASTKGSWMDKAAKAADDITPFLSNVANGLRRAPRPKMGKMISSVSMTSPSLDQERAEIDRSVRGLDRSADMNLDANSAAAVKTANLTQALRAKGQSWSNQEQMKIQAQNQTNSINANIEAINAGKVDQYQNNQTEMQVANAREQSQNLSNFADKRVQQMAHKDAMILDKKKFGILSQVYGSGVLDRLVKKVSDGDVDEALGIKRAFGGPLDDTKPGTATFGSQAELDKANKFAKGFAQRRGLVSGESTYVGRNVGDAKPYFITDGKPAIRKPLTVPNNITRQDIQTADGIAWYTDPQSGDIVDIDMSVLNQPRFRVSEEKVSADLTARQSRTRRAGGYINGTIRRMTKGKLRKIY